MLFGDDDESCAVCGKLYPAFPREGVTAHWGGPGEVVIVAWTCTPACTYAYEAASIR